MEIRLSDLKDKVTTVSGERLGSNVILDSTSGELKTLVISSEGEIDGYQVDSDNMLNIPCSVRSVKDMVIENLNLETYPNRKN